MLHQTKTWILLSFLSLACAGCCCVPSNSCDRGFGACGSDCGPGPISRLASCRGGCGEVYFDEWHSEPPVADQCGFDCGGCGRCGNCQPIRNMLRLLWGTPYKLACCPTCGPSCDGGCDSGLDGGVVYQGDRYAGHHHSGSDCNCGNSHSSYDRGPLQPIPQSVPQKRPPAPPKVPQEAVPTPAPEVTPSSARRLNPAIRRR